MYVYQNLLKDTFFIKGKQNSYRIVRGINMIPEKLDDPRLKLISAYNEKNFMDEPEIIPEKPEIKIELKEIEHIKQSKIKKQKKEHKNDIFKG